jgi:hypothetical protein
MACDVKLVPELRHVRRRDGRVVVDLTHSANLYLAEFQGDAYEAMLVGGTYAQQVSKTLALGPSFLGPLLEMQFAGRHGPVVVVDCGPGTAETAVAQLRHVSQFASELTYVPIDVNGKLLKNVTHVVGRQFDMAINPICARFEDVDAVSIPERMGSLRVVLFGATGINYETGELKRILTALAGPRAIVAFDFLLRVPGADCVSAYRSRAVGKFAFGPLRLLGGKANDFAFEPRWRAGRVSLEFRAQRRTRLALDRCSTLEKGDVVCTAFSRRPTSNEYLRLVKQILRKSHTVIADHVLATTVGEMIAGVQ